MVMASAEHSDHQTMLLMVPKPATPVPPSPSLHVYFLLSGEQPTSPSLPANRPCPQWREASGVSFLYTRRGLTLLSQLCRDFVGKDSDAGRDWGQEEKVTTEDEMAGWHH